MRKAVFFNYSPGPRAESAKIKMMKGFVARVLFFALLLTIPSCLKNNGEPYPGVGGNTGGTGGTGGNTVPGGGFDIKVPPGTGGSEDQIDAPIRCVSFDEEYVATIHFNTETEELVLRSWLGSPGSYGLLAFGDIEYVNQPTQDWYRISMNGAWLAINKSPNFELGYFWGLFMYIPDGAAGEVEIEMKCNLNHIQSDFQIVPTTPTTPSEPSLDMHLRKAP